MPRPKPMPYKLVTLEIGDSLAIANALCITFFTQSRRRLPSIPKINIKAISKLCVDGERTFASKLANGELQPGSLKTLREILNRSRDNNFEKMRGYDFKVNTDKRYRFHVHQSLRENGQGKDASIIFEPFACNGRMITFAVYDAEGIPIQVLKPKSHQILEI